MNNHIKQQNVDLTRATISGVSFWLDTKRFQSIAHYREENTRLGQRFIFDDKHMTKWTNVFNDLGRELIPGGEISWPELFVFCGNDESLTEYLDAAGVTTTLSGWVPSEETRTLYATATNS